MEGLTSAELFEMAAKRQAQEERQSAQKRAKLASGPQELVPASPSPRKKRRADDFDPSSSSSSASRFGAKVAQPSFFDRPKLERKLSGQDGKAELVSRPKESRFASHESALPKSFAESLAQTKAVAAAKQQRQQQRQERSLGFGDLSRESKNVLLEGKSGCVQLFDKVSKRPNRGANGKETAERVKKGKEPEEDETDSLLRKAAAAGSGGGGIGRPSNKPSSSTARPAKLAASTSSVPAVEDEKPSIRHRDEDDDLDIVGGPKKRSRNKDGTVIEEIEMGPREFEPRGDDPNWEKVEPYSGIKLRKRLLSHSSVDALLDGRYHLTASQIYSMARIDSRQRIDLEPEAIDSDWVVIGVLAQKGEVRFMNSNPYGGKGAPSPKMGEDGEEVGDDEDEDEEEPAGPKRKGGKGGKGGKSAQGAKESLFAAPTRKKRSQKYLRFDLVDFSSSRASQSGHGRLNVMLIEADTVDKAIDDDGNEVNVYKGQSGGAYEKFWKETPGAVVAILNPSFMNYSNKYPTYTLKPTSADSMVVIGRAEHLAFCDAITKEGKSCGSWVDDRAGKYCEYHVKRALQRTGNSRPETYTNTNSLIKQGTMNMSQLRKSFSAGGGSSASKASGAVVIGGGGATKPKNASTTSSAAQVLFGSTVHVSSGSRTSTMTMRASSILPTSLTTAAGSKGGGSFVSGVREGPSVSEEKKRRKRQAEEDKRARRELKELVRSDRGKTNGGELVRMAGEAMGKGKGKKETKGESSEEDSEEEEMPEKKRRSVLSGLAARRIGFDPTAKPGQVERDQSSEAKESRSLLADGLTNSKREFNLDAPPGPRLRSVGAPVSTSEGPIEQRSAVQEDSMAYSDDDLVVEGGPKAGKMKISLAGITRTAA
ncbi:hypothetical protein JCM11641_003415 [Rhodosporidiobolus odoratus]